MKGRATSEAKNLHQQSGLSFIYAREGQADDEGIPGKGIFSAGSLLFKYGQKESFLISRVYVIFWYTNTYNIHIVTCKRGSGKGILKGEFWCWLVGCQIFLKTYLKRKVEHLTGSLFDSFQTLILNVDIANIHWRNRVRPMMGDFPGRGFPEGLVLVVG